MHKRLSSTTRFIFIFMFLIFCFLNKYDPSAMGICPGFWNFGPFDIRRLFAEDMTFIWILLIKDCKS